MAAAAVHGNGRATEIAALSLGVGAGRRRSNQTICPPPHELRKP